MSLTFRWVDGESDLDRVAECRVRCYAPAAKELARYQELIRGDERGKLGDYLLAERGGRAIGTTTSLSMNMWVRGVRLPCQGVAWVGTVRTARRGAIGESGGAGVASQLMFETLKKARERQQVVSALMPFRVSFYEHFGYGIVERRAEWTVASGALPSGSCDGVRYVEPDDLDAIMSLRQRTVERGRCDIETIPVEWTRRRRQAEGGFEVVDRADGGSGPARGFMYLAEHEVAERRYARVAAQEYDSTDALVRQLRMLGSLKDQFSGATITLPVDVPLNYLLREAQIPHRPVEHAAPGLVVYTRMQMRVLDHVRFFEGQVLPPEAGAISDRVTVAVRETEGTTSKFRLESEDGRLRATATDASADVECSDVRWASIVSGELRATTAARLGLISVSRSGALELLDVLSAGPAPWCNEYF